MSQEKKRLHKKVLNVATYYEGRVQPHSPEIHAASKQKLLEMAQRDKERMMLEEARNNVEAYIYKIKNKLEDDSEAIGAVTTEEQRDAVRKLAEDAQEWMEDEGYAADYATVVDKYAEISTPFEKILLRVKESVDRPAAIAALKKKLDEVEQLMVQWTEKMPHITAEDKEPVVKAISDVRKWIEDKEEAQAKKSSSDDPVFLSDDVPEQMKPIEALVVKLSRKPKPKPVKNETKSDDDSSTTNDNATKASDSETGKESANASNDETDEKPSGSTSESTDAPVSKEDEL